jgi:glutathione S-transferase
VTPADALAIARESRPAAGGDVDPAEPNGLAPGMPVTVTADDYAFDPVAGELVQSSADEVAVRRRDPAVGEVVVHFPRYGFRVARA